MTKHTAIIISIEKSQQIYFEKKEQNPNREAYFRCRTKIKYPDDSIIEQTSFLKAKKYYYNPDKFELGSTIQIYKWQSDKFNHVWLIEEMSVSLKKIDKLFGIENSNSNKLKKQTEDETTSKKGCWQPIVLFLLGSGLIFSPLNPFYETIGEDNFMTNSSWLVNMVLWGALIWVLVKIFGREE